MRPSGPEGSLSAHSLSDPHFSAVAVVRASTPALAPRAPKLRPRRDNSYKLETASHGRSRQNLAPGAGQHRAVEAVRPADACRDTPRRRTTLPMAKIAKTGDRKKVMDTTKSTDCPKCSKPTRIVKRVKDRERGVPGGVYISCSACDFYEKL